jgi:serine/threonine-protein kinase
MLRRCLTKDAHERLHDIADARLEITAGDDESLVRPVNRGLTRSVWLAVVLLVVIGVSFASLWIAWRSAQQVVSLPMDLSVDLGPDARLGSVIISPDGSRLVFSSQDADGRPQLSSLLLNQPDSTPLSDTLGASSPFFSPDGQWIGFFAGGSLKKVSIQGGKALTICPTEGANRGGTWGEDGNIIFHTAAGSGLFRVSDKGGTPQPLTQLDTQKGEQTHRFPQILPGGDAVLFTVANNVNDFNEATIEVLSLKTGNRKPLQRGGFFGRYLPASHGTGYLAYVHQSTLFIAPMFLGNGNLDKITLRGPAVPLIEQVASTTNGSAQFDASRAGTLVYVSGGVISGGWSMAWIDNTGKMERLRPSADIYFDLRVSPEGKRLGFLDAAAGGLGISTYDWERDTTYKLPSTASDEAFVWTPPDGKRIVYASQSGSTYHLSWMWSDGSSAAVPLTESKRRQSPYSFSPDSNSLVYVEEGENTFADIWTLPIDWSDPEYPKAGKPEVFLQTKALETQPAFSPDGRWVAYASAEAPNEKQEIYVRPFPPNPSGGQVKISNEGGAYPTWSRNGTELFYQTPNGIMAVTYVVRGSAFLAGKPNLWSNRRPVALGRRNYDLAPDGRLAMLVSAATFRDQRPKTHVNLLLNVFEELRRRVPAGGK